MDLFQKFSSPGQKDEMWPTTGSRIPTRFFDTLVVLELGFSLRAEGGFVASVAFKLGFLNANARIICCLSESGMQMHDYRRNIFNSR